MHLSELTIAARAQVSDLGKGHLPRARDEGMPRVAPEGHPRTKQASMSKSAAGRRDLLMATSARGREENEELAPMTAWGCDKLRSAVKLCRTDHPSQAASPRVTKFSHGFKRTESLHVENLLDRSVTRLPQGCTQKVAPVVRGTGGAGRLASASLLGKAGRALDKSAKKIGNRLSVLCPAGGGSPSMTGQVSGDRIRF